MKRFGGFPARMQFTPVPNVFISRLMAEIDDITELKVTLHIFAMVYQKKGYPRFVTSRELESAGLTGSLGKGLEQALARGTILRLDLEGEGGREELYFLNTPSDRQAIEKIKRGELNLSGLKLTEVPIAEIAARPDIFTLYEENIGILTPMTAEELREAEKLYPEGWIRDAIKEAVRQNKRKWSYIAAILERWAAEGRDDGAHQRDSKTDPDRYIKGKYGHMVRR